MSNCEQTKGQSVLQHGESVRDYLFDLIEHLKYGKPLSKEWKLPEWIGENRYLFLDDLPDKKTLELYTVYHDCGKPFCKIVDSDGKIHFPDHAEISYHVFSHFFNNPVAAELIRRDMEIHLLKSDEAEDFAKTPHALTLLLAGLAEIHSNCRMFGGVDSTSFKIKWKKINQRGKQILQTIKTNSNDNK